jgi:MoaA/NifB/PqqE/SkfB family radical SAM enzyme
MKPEQSPAARLNALTLERNIPVSVTIEVTRRCPLNCRHCYLPETRGRAAPGPELTAAQWGKILAQLAEAGALYLVFTGGEPLLRPDLAELCARAKKLKFDVRIFSTGLGLDRALALRLKKAGVSGFEISFYGRAQIHDAITGLKGSFEGSLSASRLLKKAGIKVKMKIPLMKTNLPQTGWLKALAKREGFGISFDPVITTANDGNTAALKFRLSSRQLSTAVALLFPHFSSLIPHPSSLIPHPSSLILHPNSCS